jgi:hypothetical protein
LKYNLLSKFRIKKEEKAMNYAITHTSGKQYLLIPGQWYDIDYVKNGNAGDYLFFEKMRPMIKKEDLENIRVLFINFFIFYSVNNSLEFLLAILRSLEILKDPSFVEELIGGILQEKKLQGVVFRQLLNHIEQLFEKEISFSDAAKEGIIQPICDPRILQQKILNQLLIQVKTADPQSLEVNRLNYVSHLEQINYKYLSESHTIGLLVVTLKFLESFGDQKEAILLFVNRLILLWNSRGCIGLSDKLTKWIFTKAKASLAWKEVAAKLAGSTS